jgi:hypothetical protein
MYSNLLDEDKDEIAEKHYNTKGEYVRTWLTLTIIFKK